MKRLLIIFLLWGAYLPILSAQDFKDLLIQYPEISLSAAPSNATSGNLLSFAPDSALIDKLAAGSDLLSDSVKRPLYFNALPQGYKHLAAQFNIAFGNTGKSERGSLLRILNPLNEQGPKTQIFRELLSINIAALGKDLKFLTFRDLTLNDAIWQLSPFSSSIRRLEQANRQDELLGSNLTLNDFFVWSESPATFQILNYTDEKSFVLIDPAPWKIIEREGCLNLNSAGALSSNYQYAEVAGKKLQLFANDIFSKSQKIQVVFDPQGLAIEKNLLGDDNSVRQKTYALLKPARMNDGRELYFYSAIYVISAKAKAKITFEQVNFCPQKSADLGFSELDPSKSLFNSL